LLVVVVVKTVDMVLNPSITMQVQIKMEIQAVVEVLEASVTEVLTVTVVPLLALTVVQVEVTSLTGKNQAHLVVTDSFKAETHLQQTA
jgi:hypothetical protein